VLTCVVWIGFVFEGAPYELAGRMAARHPVAPTEQLHLECRLSDCKCIVQGLAAYSSAAIATFGAAGRGFGSSKGPAEQAECAVAVLSAAVQGGEEDSKSNANFHTSEHHAYVRPDHPSGRRPGKPCRGGERGTTDPGLRFHRGRTHGAITARLPGTGRMKLACH